MKYLLQTNNLKYMGSTVVQASYFYFTAILQKKSLDVEFQNSCERQYMMN